MTTDSPLIVAIDGPAASGKSTVAKRVAAALGIVFVNSGAMYRAFTWWVLRNRLDPSDTSAVLGLLRTTEFTCGEENGVGTIAVGGIPMTRDELAATEVNAGVSLIAAIPEVRERLVAEQRRYASARGVVMEGRDIGSVVFPDTPYKFYIDASPEVREARRRAEGIDDSIAKRDRIDSSRKASPLVIPEDAVVVDSSFLSADEVVDTVIAVIRERMAHPSR
jgi:cytidylate kinase